MKFPGILLLSCLLIIVQQALIAFLIFGNSIDPLCGLKSIPKVVKKLQKIATNEKNKAHVYINRRREKKNRYRINNSTGPFFLNNTWLPTRGDYAKSAQPTSKYLNVFSKSVHQKSKDDKPCVNIHSECRAYYSSTTVIQLF